MTNQSSSLTLTYEGSVKRVWQAPLNPDRLWFEFTDDYSIFDFGKMPDKIANKGKALAILGAFLFDKLKNPHTWSSLSQSPYLEKFDKDWLKNRWSHPTFSGSSGLSKRGASTHFTGLIAGDYGSISDFKAAAKLAEPLYMEVLKASIGRPELHSVLSQNLYFYPHAVTKSNYHSEKESRRLIPLEIVFRFGMPKGSSLTERLQDNPNYARSLGLKRLPEEEGWFDHPIIEFFTKLETKDRLLSHQEAALISGLDAKSFEYMSELALNIACALHVIFAQSGMELWDGKIELVESLSDNGKTNNFLIADSIGPDELRLLYQGCHLSKELIRQYYRGSQWEMAIKEAQSLAKLDSKRNWKQILIDDLKATPSPLSATFKSKIDLLYGMITNQVIGEPLFVDHPSPKDFIHLLDSDSRLTHCSSNRKK